MHAFDDVGARAEYIHAPLIGRAGHVSEGCISEGKTIERKEKKREQGEIGLDKRPIPFWKDASRKREKIHQNKGI